MNDVAGGRAMLEIQYEGEVHISCFKKVYYTEAICIRFFSKFDCNV